MSDRLPDCPAAEQLCSAQIAGHCYAPLNCDSRTLDPSHGITHSETRCHATAAVPWWAGCQLVG
jgi:hypothetical protein